MDEQQTEEEAEGGGGLNLEIVKSYASFVRRAIRKRLLLVLPVFAIGAALTIVVYKYLPRTYVSTTVMMAEGNQVFNDWSAASFAAAANLIMRRENIETLVRETDLVKKFDARRPPLLKSKDELMQRVFGKWDDAAKHSAMVGTLESRLSVTSDGPTMTVSVAWSDPKTAAELAEAARLSFLKARHNSEMSAFQEKMKILDGHASKLREEIEQLAAQIKSDREEQTAKATSSASASASSAVKAAPVRFPVRMPTPVADTVSPEQKEKLDTLKRKLADLEGERDRRLREERAKLADLRLRFGPSHPDVLTTEQKITMLAQEPSELALLRAEIKALGQEISARDALGRMAPGLVRSSSGAASAADPLPPAITELLKEDDADPALLAQLSGAVGRYGGLRDELRSSRIDLDTAQAAFVQRYKLIVPAQAPTKPVKPKPAVVLGGGIGAALLLALLLPILLELRTGIIVERWQVEMVHLPVLGELRLPPRSGS